MRLRMHRAAFIRLCESNDAGVEAWVKNGSSVGFPLMPQPPRLPTKGFFVSLGQGKSEDAVLLSAEVKIVIFRRFDVWPATPDEQAEVIRTHRELDISAILAIAADLFDHVPERLERELVGATREFYQENMLVATQPVLRMRIAENIHICSHCRSIGAKRQCACRGGVYYCDRECQKADWPEHRVTCSRQH